MQIMVRWYHVILSAYGFWLPNDPRGSWSDFVWSYELYRFGGKATTVAGKRSYAHDPHDVQRRRTAKQLLRSPAVRFEDACRQSIATGFARACQEFGFVIHAAAIGFDHLHLVVARDMNRTIEGVVAVLKARATTQMNCDGTHPLRSQTTNAGAVPTPWAKNCWSVFIDDQRQLRNAIEYVERHPMKEGMAPQRWEFVAAV